MSTFQDLTIHADNRVLSLPVAQLGPLFDPVQRVLSGTAKHRKYSQIPQGGNAVVSPFPGGNHTTIERQDHRKFGTVKGNLLRVRKR